MARQNEYAPRTVSHPGETLVEKLEEMEMGVKEFALRTGKPEKTEVLRNNPFDEEQVHVNLWNGRHSGRKFLRFGGPLYNTLLCAT